MSEQNDILLEIHGHLMGRDSVIPRELLLQKIERAIVLCGGEELKAESPWADLVEIENETYKVWCLHHGIEFFGEAAGIRLVRRLPDGALTQVIEAKWRDAIRRIARDLSILTPWAARAINHLYP